MKNRIPLFALFVILCSGLAAVAQGTFFEFSGTLASGGLPANGNYDMSFQLFPQAVGGTASSAILNANAINVTNGQFTVSLDMGSVFDGSSDFWMELGAKPAGSSGSLVIVTPRIPIVASALALFATKAGSVVSGNIINPNFLGTTNATPFDLFAHNQRAFRLDGSGQDPNIIGGNSGNFIGAGAIGATISGGGTIGFTNRVLGSYGTISGGLNNLASGYAATVAGGQQNTATGQSSAALGGYGNVAGGDYSVAAGTLNRATAATAAAVGGSANTASGINSFVSGGTNSVSGNASSSPGGSLNLISGSFSFISGGQANTNSGNYSFIAGGSSNATTQNFTFAAGRRAKANHQGAFVLADSQDLDFASTANNQLIVRAAGNVGINTNKPATALHVVGTVTATSFIGSGSGITNIGALGLASNSVANAAITNGTITASKIGSNQVVKSINVVQLPLPPITMRENVSFAPGANIFLSANTNSNTIQISADISNSVPAWSTIGNWGMGPTNYAGTADTVPFQLRVNGVHAMRYEASSNNTPNIIGGASGNNVRAGISGATIGGGGNTNGPFNSVQDNFGTVSGGVGNVAGNGTTNIYASVGGGANNSANGFASTVPGGLLNSATNFGFAAGRRAKDVHAGTFVWADATDADFSSTAANQFLIRAGGGVGINTATPGAGIALNVNGVFKATSFANNQLVKSITATGGSTLRDDIVLSAGANISLVTSGNSIQISANSPGNIGWATDGNLATSTNSFIGTADNMPLEMRVNSARVMRFEPTLTTPNI
ncbi:MAG: beta strand repeat-containing protein, partial [Limisphaerales bacterium]